jgi:hypothetical protein
LITIVTGPPAAGKSAHVSDNAQPGDVRIDFDAIAQALGAPLAHASSGAVRQVARATRKAAIAAVLEGVSEPAWIIHTSPTDEQLATYKAAGAALVEINPGIDVVLAQAAADSRPDGTDQAIRAWFSNREEKAVLMPAPAETVRRLKSFTPVTFKAEGQSIEGDTTLGPGEFIALASVFTSIDSYGDRLVRGAFAETLANWKASGDPIPVIWQHNWTDPFAHIGAVVWAKETEQGLLYKGRLDIEENPFAAQVYGLMKGRRVTQQSFGFDVLDAAEVFEDGKSVFEIRKVHLFEVGPCLVGVNQATDLLDIKSGGVAPGPGAAEPRGQVSTPAAGAPSTAPGSAPEAPASTSNGPASALLSLDITQFLMEES